MNPLALIYALATGLLWLVVFVCIVWGIIAVVIKSIFGG